MTVFVSLTALDGTSVRVAPVSVAIVTPVPVELLPEGVLSGGYLRTLGDDVVAVRGSMGTLSEELNVPGEAAFATLARLGDGDDVLANPSLVSHLEPIPAALLPAGEVAGTYVRSGARNVVLNVRGTVAAVESVLEAVSPDTPDLVFAFALISYAAGVPFYSWQYGFDPDVPPDLLGTGEVELTLLNADAFNTDAWSAVVTPIDDPGFSVYGSANFTPPNRVRGVTRVGNTGNERGFFIMVMLTPPNNP